METVNELTQSAPNTSHYSTICFWSSPSYSSDKWLGCIIDIQSIITEERGARPLFYDADVYQKWVTLLELDLKEKQPWCNSISVEELWLLDAPANEMLLWQQ